MPIPSLVICELLGVPYEDREGFQALSTARFDLGLESSPLDVIGTSLDYLQGLVVKERAQPRRGAARHAGPRTRRRHQRPGARRPRRRPAHRRPRDHGELAVPGRAGADAESGATSPGSAPPTTRTRCTCAVEELLRYLTVVQVAFPRFSRDEVTIGGQRFRPARWCWCRCPPPTGTRCWRWHRLRPGDVRPGPPGRPRISPSATGSTAASAPNWPGWSCGSRSRRWPGGSPPCGRRSGGRPALPQLVDRLQRGDGCRSSGDRCALAGRPVDGDRDRPCARSALSGTTAATESSGGHPAMSPESDYLPGTSRRANDQVRRLRERRTAPGRATCAACRSSS